MDLENHETQAKILLEAIWRSLDGIHQVTSINRQTGQVCNHTVATVADAVNLALSFSAAGVDAYIALAEYQDPGNRKADNTTGAFDDRVPGRGVRGHQEVMDSGMAGMPVRVSRRTG